MEDIKKNLAEVERRIKKTESECGKNDNEVCL